MIDHSRSRFLTVDTWAGLPLYSLSPAMEEGMAMGGVFENGHQAATVVANPGVNDVFLGFCLSYYTTPTTIPAVETYTVPATTPYTVTLANAPLNPTTGLFVGTGYGGTVYTYNAGVGAGQYSAGGTNNQTLTFNAAQAGTKILVTYAYNPSVAQALQLVGDGWYGAVPSSVTGTIGQIRRGLVYTSNFDPAQPYGLNSVLTMGANGIITIGGTGPVINAKVYELPSTDFPTLGVFLQGI